MSKILVTGATGNFGKQTLNFLSKKTDVSNLAALVRDESKAIGLKDLGIEIRVGNYDDPESLKTAFKGIDKLLFISASDIAKRLPQHRNVLETAKESGIKHIVYTSFVRKNETETSPIWEVSKTHLYSEKFLLESGISYTVLQNTLYMEFAPYFMGDKVLENKMVYLPSGDGKVAFLLRSEMAEIAANILTSADHKNKIYLLSSEEAFSYGDVAGFISENTGKEIKFVSPSVDEFVATMKKAGLPEQAIGLSVGFAQAIKAGEFEATNPDISKLLDRKPTHLKEFLKKIYV